MHIRSVIASSLLGFVSVAYAQSPCGLRTHERLVTAINPSSAYADLRYDSGWVTTPPTGNLSHSSTGDGGGTVSGAFTATSDFGELSGTASGAAHGSPQTGAFTWVTSWIGGEPNAHFFDTITLSSATVPNGTFVDVEIGELLNAAASASGPSNRAYANMHGQLIGNSNYANSTVDVYFGTSVSPVLYNTGTFKARVGETFTLEGKLWFDGNADSNDYSNAERSFSMSANARSGLRILDPAVTYSACSDHVYAVPEPGMLYCLGLGLVGFTCRRRK